MKYHNVCYLTKDGSLEVEFLFADLGTSQGWRAYILSVIDYGSRSSGQMHVHRLTETDAARREAVNSFMCRTPSLKRGLLRADDIEYICWTEKVSSLQKLRSIASAWVDITAYYIRFGGDFAQIGRRLLRNDDGSSEGVWSFEVSGDLPVSASAASRIFDDDDDDDDEDDDDEPLGVVGEILTIGAYLLEALFG